MNPLTSRADRQRQRAVLQRAITLARADKDEVLRAGEWVNQIAYRPDWIKGTPDAPDPQTLAIIQQELRTMLETLARGEAAYVNPRSVRFVILPRPRRRGGSHITLTEPTLIRDRFLYRIMEALDVIGPDKLRICQAYVAQSHETRCLRLFLKVTRKEFCSPRCHARMYMRSYQPKERVNVKTKRTRRRKH